MLLLWPLMLVGRLVVGCWLLVAWRSSLVHSWGQHPIDISINIDSDIDNAFHQKLQLKAGSVSTTETTPHLQTSHLKKHQQANIRTSPLILLPPVYNSPLWAEPELEPEIESEREAQLNTTQENGTKPSRVNSNQMEQFQSARVNTCCKLFESSS